MRRKRKVYWQTSDAARCLAVSPGGVRYLVLTGQLHPIAHTRSGGRLFEPNSVEALARKRAVPAFGKTKTEKERATSGPSAGFVHKG